MSDKGDYKGPIFSAILGATFFAVPYLGIGLSILPSIAIGAVAFGAGNLFLSDSNKEPEYDPNKSFYDMLNDAKKQNAAIYGMADKVDDITLKSNIKEIHDTAGKIIDTISKNPKKLNQANSFFNYYLPVTLKILTKYDDIENQRLNNKTSNDFMKSTQDMITKINNSFKEQLSNLYQSDIIDTDAEMKVFEAMLKSEGINDIKDFDIK